MTAFIMETQWQTEPFYKNNIVIKTLLLFHQHRNGIRGRLHCDLFSFKAALQHHGLWGGECRKNNFR